MTELGIDVRNRCKFKMLNVFYIHSILWTIITVLYLLGWSDLCTPLSGKVCFFLLFIIISSALLGVHFNDRFRYYRIEENPHKKKTSTIFVVGFGLLDILYARQVPLITILNGGSLYDSNFVGIPILHSLYSAFLYLYCLYLIYLFICFRKRSLLFEYLLSLSYFVLLFQRQNIIMIFLLSMWIFVADTFSRRKPQKTSKIKKITKIVFYAVVILVALYIFGRIGNVRYGLWSADDSSMIMTLGRINSKYPSWLPKEFSWSYIYLVSPLANLNYNVNLGVESASSIGMIIHEFLPEMITTRIPGMERMSSSLLVSSLTVCTAYSSIYRCCGMVGALVLYAVITLVTIFAITLSGRSGVYEQPFHLAVSYFYLLTFFTNSLFYTTSFLVVIYVILGTYLMRVRFKIGSHRIYIGYTRRD